jgi:hypothetical protein
MRNPLVLGFAWIATVVVAWLLGSASGRNTEPKALPATLETSRTIAPECEPVPSMQETPREQPQTPVRADTPPPGRIDQALTLVGIGNAGEASDLLMAYMARMLERGPVGHRELLRTFSRLLDEGTLPHLFRNERDFQELLYPWFRFLVSRKAQVVAAMETVYRTAAEEPAFFEGLHEDSLDIFGEPISFVLPGAVDTETLARMRGYVETILAQPKESLPDALRRNLPLLKRSLEWWSPPIPKEEILRRIADPSVPLDDRLALLRKLKQEELSQVDLAGLSVEAIRNGREHTLWALHRVPMNGGNLQRLDQAFLDAAAAGKTNAWAVRKYLQGTRRSEWVLAQPFIESGLALGGRASVLFADSLLHLAATPDREFVRDLLARYRLPATTRRNLERRFGLE